jgi:hypothetical protein
VIVNKELLGGGKKSMSAISVKCNMKPNANKAISEELYKLACK